jgi:hypothetical protein
MHGPDPRSGPIGGAFTGGDKPRRYDRSRDRLPWWCWTGINPAASLEERPGGLEKKRGRGKKPALGVRRTAYRV